MNTTDHKLTSMLTHTLSNGDVLGFVEVPDGAEQITLRFIFPYWHINYEIPQESNDSYSTSGGLCLFFKDFGGKEKYPKKLQLIGNTVAASLTEEEWAGVVHNIHYTGKTKYRNYESDSEYRDAFDCLNEAKNSGKSLLSSLSLNPNNTVVLIQKVNK